MQISVPHGPTWQRQGFEVRLDHVQLGLKLRHGRLPNGFVLLPLHPPVHGHYLPVLPTDVSDVFRSLEIVIGYF